MSGTIPLKHPLDPGLPRRQEATEPAPPAPAPAVADLSKYHHPHYVRSEPGQHEGWTVYTFSPFTGREPEPEIPSAVYDDKTVTWEQHRALGAQYEAARITWSKARFRLQAHPLLRQAAPLWEAWTQAQAELHATFKVFWQTPDGSWRAQLLRLTDAEQAAKKAAAAWDGLAEKLARIADEHVRAAGEWEALDLKDVAKEIGLDATQWWIDHISGYESSSYYRVRSTPLVEHVTGEIAQQRERLREVADLAGDSGLEHRALG
ncbi:hypothetical protein [Streptomyces triculaminicus]|uniref:hypothetical protein n=1 Tax=Streptomyces triculaminicus TaxID=2816232 RepID=UPI0037D58B9C